MTILPLVSENGVGIGAEDGSGSSLRLLTESIGALIYFAVTQYYAHAATNVSLWLAEDTYACAVLFERIDKVVWQRVG